MLPDATTAMRLTVNVPTEVIVDSSVVHVAAEAPEGHFVLLPRHIDFVSLIVPGVLTYRPTNGRSERYLGVDEGVLVKCGAEVRLALRDAVEGEDLQDLRALVEQRYIELDEEVRRARSALAQLEAGAVRRFVELEKA